MSRSFFGKKEEKQKNEKQGITKEVTPRKTQRKEEEEEEDNDSMVTKVKVKRRRMLDDSDEEDVAMETNKADAKSNDELSQNEATPTNHTSPIKTVCRPAKLDIKTPPKRSTGM